MAGANEKIQNNVVFVIGGHKETPTLVAGEYEAARSCLHIDLYSGILTLKAQLVTGRW